MGIDVQSARTFNSALDCRNFHLFEYRGDKMLFDLSTGALCELNEFAYRFLELCGQHSINEAFALLKAEYPTLVDKEGEKLLSDLQSRGLFEYQPVDVDKQHEYIDGLWRHKPRRLQLFLAQCCNLACRYCYAENNKSNAKHVLMSWDVAKHAVDYLVRRSGRRRNLQITFFGGEPLLNLKVLKQVVEYCSTLTKSTGKRFVYELICNGTLLDKDVADYVAEREFLLFISIDGWREMHNYNRPSVDGKDMYDTILKNAKYAVTKYRKRNPQLKVKIRANMTPRYHDMKSIVHYLESQGFDKIGIAGIQPLVYDACTPCALSEEQLDDLDTTYEQFTDDSLGMMQQGKSPGPYLSRLMHLILNRQLTCHAIMGIMCGIGRNTNAVDCKGNIYPCHRYVGMDAYIIGNIYEGLSPSKTIGLYNKYNERAMSQCSECWARWFCSGGCPWELSAPTGKVWDRSPTMCDRIKHGLEKALWIEKEMRKVYPDQYAKIKNRHTTGDGGLEQWKW